jgi:hypothetical protein
MRIAPFSCCVGERHAHGLLDDLIRQRQQGRRDREAERLGRLEVDDQLELGRLLDGEIAGFGAFQNLVHMGRGAPMMLSARQEVDLWRRPLHIQPSRSANWFVTAAIP